MSKWKIYTPEGVQDILFDECYAKRSLEDRMRKLFRSYGFMEIETPTYEFYDVFTTGVEGPSQESMFKFFDQQGRILALRPDMTIPVARIAGTKYKDMPSPLRVSYISNVFRYNEYGGGKQNEFTQAGVEILGVNSPEADAEVIVLAINALKEAGLEDFQIDIGQVEFFKGVVEECGLQDNDVEKIKTLVDRKDFVGLGELVGSFSIRDDLKELILGLPGLFGSTEVIERVKQMTSNKRSMDALENIHKVLEIISDYGLGKYVSVDLGMLKGLAYDTGIIFRGFTHGVGFPILTGGRYDNLVEEFGRSCPATGFSLGINMLMMAMERQKAPLPKQSIDIMVCYEGRGRKTAFDICGELRRQGLTVEADITGDVLEAVKDRAIAKGIGGLLVVWDDSSLEIHNLETGDIKRTTVEELVNG